MAIVFGIVEILLEMDFYNDFLKYKMSQFTGLKRQWHGVVMFSVITPSLPIVSNNSQLSHSFQGVVVTVAKLTKLITYQ